MTPEELKAHITQVWGELKNSLGTQAEEIKTLKETRDETSQKIAALETKLSELLNEFTDLVRKSAVPAQPPHAVVESIGKQFINSDQYSAYIQQKQRVSSPFTVKTLRNPRGLKALSVQDLPSFSAMPYGGFSDVSLERITLRDLLTVVPTTEGANEYVRATGFAPVMTELTAQATATATTLVVDSTVGFVSGQNIMVGTESRVVDAITDATHMDITVGLTALKAVGTKVSAKFAYPTAEGGTKPTGGWKSLTVESATMRTIATSVDASRQIISDQNQLQSLIDNQLAFEAGFSEHFQILYGDGTSPNLNGILNDPDHQTYNWSDGQTGDTKIDALRRAMTLVTLARYPADGIAINPTDWEDIELAKGSDGHYLWISVPNGAGAGNETFFRLPVSVTEAVVPGTSVVGAWKLGATLFDREQANVRISEDYNDYFKKNMVAVLGEERVALGVNRPEAFVEVTFDNAPS